MVELGPQAFPWLSDHDATMLLTTYGSILNIGRVQAPEDILTHTDLSREKAHSIVSFFNTLQHFS